MSQFLDKITTLTCYKKENDFLITIFGNFYQDIISGNQPIILFGAGNSGISLCKEIVKTEAKIDFFCDNNENRVGDDILDIPILSVQNLLANYQEQLVVISVSWQFQQEIKTQLVKLGIPLDKILLLPQDPLQYATFNSEHSWPLEDIKLNLQQLEKVYQLLFDSKSKNLYLTRLSLLAGAYNYKAYKAYIRNYADLVNDYNEGSDVDSAPIYDEDYFYFNNEIFELHDDEVFVNVGALVGNCAQNFIETCKQKNVRYKQIINFEPDPINFAFLEKNMQPFDGIENINAGLWNKKDTLRFSSPQDKSIGIPGLIDQNGEVEIDVYSLDELFPESGVTYIKMDVEGAELKALEGAAETIKNNKPKLAISLYHKRDDIWQIPLLLNNLVAEYKFFIRHYSTTFTETVLYALP